LNCCDCFWLWRIRQPHADAHDQDCGDIFTNARAPGVRTPSFFDHPHPERLSTPDRRDLTSWRAPGATVTLHEIRRLRKVRPRMLYLMGDSAHRIVLNSKTPHGIRVVPPRDLLQIGASVSQRASYTTFCAIGAGPCTDRKQLLHDLLDPFHSRLA
jgi:hypothetical protein